MERFFTQLILSVQNRDLISLCSRKLSVAVMRQTSVAPLATVYNLNDVNVGCSSVAK